MQLHVGFSLANSLVSIVLVITWKLFSSILKWQSIRNQDWGRETYAGEYSTLCRTPGPSAQRWRATMLAIS